MVIKENLPLQSNSPIKLGMTLRAAREQQGWSLADVESQIKLPIQRLQALENEDFAQLPDMSFVRGFVRSYGKLLRLDVPMLLAALPDAPQTVEAIAPVAADVPLTSQVAIRRKQNVVWLAAAAAVVLIAAIFAIWSINTPKTKPAPKLQDQEIGQVEFPAALPASSVAFSASSMVVTPQSAVVATTLPASAVIPAGSVSLRLVFDEEAWVEVKEHSGKTLSSQLNPTGSELTLTGRPPFSLVIGNSPSVHLYYKGAEVDLSGHISRSGSAIARLELE